MGPVAAPGELMTAAILGGMDRQVPEKRTEGESEQKRGERYKNQGKDSKGTEVRGRGNEGDREIEDKRTTTSVEIKGNFPVFSFILLKFLQKSIPNKRTEFGQKTTPHFFKYTSICI